MTLLLLGLVIVEVVAQAGNLFGLSNSVAGLLSVGLAFVIFVVHGWLNLGPRNLLAFFLITFLISFAAEASGVATGLVFGPYHYTNLFGPKILGVPPMIQAAYCAMGYSSLMIARLLLRMRSAPSRLGGILGLSLLAAMIMVAWDLSMDPFQSTVFGIWIWHNPGPYFGVGIHNYAGWFVTVFLYVLIYHLFAARWPEQPSGTVLGSRLFLSVPVLLYAALGLGNVTPAIFGGVTQPYASPNNYTGSVESLVQSMALVAIFSMGILVVAALLILGREAVPSRWD
jgi:putative membrane protein